MKILLLNRVQVRSLGIAVGIVFGVFFASVFLVRLIAPGSSASTAGWEPVRHRQAGSAGSDATILSGLRIPSDMPRTRLLAVMIENHESARPHQEGIADALMVWEFPVEGFITRFAVVFDADALPKRVGPVRSLRPYFIDALRPLVSTVIHAGASPEAYAKAHNGDITAIDLLSHYGSAERDAHIPEPHNLFIERPAIVALPGDAIAGTPWPPYAVGNNVSSPAAETVTLNFYNPDHDVAYRYSRLRDAYIRSSGSVADQGHPRNVLVLEMPVTGIGEMGRLTIPVTGNGRALLFRSGTVQEGVWRKKDLMSSFVFETADGSSILFAPGQTWVTVLPSFDRVEWE
ncbi:MAG: DUF3048 domain-containing protein [Candidatus Peribacteraceae bacterium]|nr:DUF3048 domain-containing protein [Candidatus Peribacteraceae bacterium]MDD5742736.1 DUF3048 domain-containing protein [Candidatus Peribacteraceae bacterium]